MNPALKDVWEHMLDLGLHALAHANRHTCYGDPAAPRWSELGVLQAAHAAELLIKARIAQEHPLLIFEQLPRPADEIAELNIADLFEQGRTIQWAELPARLWAATGLRLSDAELYRKFGRLRNGIQHFGAPSGRDVATETLSFVFGVLDPFINECWDLCAIDYDEDDEQYVYLVGAIVHHEIPFLVSPEAAKTFPNWSVDWDKVSPDYRNEIRKRVDEAVAKGTPGPVDQTVNYFTRK